MFTKTKLAIVMCASLLCGVAAAQGPANGQDFKAKRQAMKAEKLQKFDTNKNGTLEPAEKTAMHDERATAMFKKLDTDGNGTLSLAEFKAGKKAMKHARGGKFHGRGKHAGARGGRGWRGTMGTK